MIDRLSRPGEHKITRKDVHNFEWASNKAIRLRTGRLSSINPKYTDCTVPVTKVYKNRHWYAYSLSKYHRTD